MSVITILLFFIYTLGLGYSITFFFKNSDNFFERLLIRIGIGLGVLPFLLVLLNLFRIPIDWKIIFAVSLIMPLISLIRHLNKGFKLPKIKLNKSDLYSLIALILFSLTLFMYLKGAFIYPYLEDYDPWAHAVGVKYISIEKNFDDPTNVLVYLKPYPPGYDGLMAILHQTSPSLMWALKFFNALIISLGIIFFYFFTKNFMDNRNKALIAILILAMIPCYLSHFIWAHSMVMTLLIVSLYCLKMIDIDKRWLYPTILVISGICLTQPSKAMKFVFIFGIYFIVKSIYSKKFLFNEFLAIVGGYLLSAVWWITNYRTMAEGYIFKRIAVSSTESLGVITKIFKIIQKIFPPTSGSATRPYTFGDFFIAKSQNMINNPIGVGIVISLLLLISLILIIFSYKSMKKEKKIWVTISLFWLLFTFLGINTMTFNLPIGFYAFRFWMIFAIPVSILSAEGFWFVVTLFRQIKIPKAITILLLVFLMFLTSGKQKYAVNTAIWYPGNEWTSMEDSLDYSWLRANLPANTKVFTYTGDEKAISFDMFSCAWCSDVIEFRNSLLYKNASELYNWLKRNEYKYLTIDGIAFSTLASTFGENRTNELLPKRFQEIGSFENFQVVYQTKGMAVFKVM